MLFSFLIKATGPTIPVLDWLYKEGFPPTGIYWFLDRSNETDCWRSQKPFFIHPLNGILLTST